jgi:two-component system cell cycle sensor histidine kinase/response regulator CckA
MGTNHSSRADRDLWLTITIAVLLAVYGLGASVSTEIANWIQGLAPSTPGVELFLDVTLKALYGWLLIMLFVAYRRWRSEVTRRRELEELVESIRPDVLIVTDTGGAIATCTGPVQYMFGFEPQELIGQQIATLLEDQPAAAENSSVADQLRGVGFEVGQALAHHRDGHTFTLETVRGTINENNQVVVLLRDVSEQSRVRLMLRESEQRFDSFMAQLPAIATIRSTRGQYLYGNARILQLLGLSPKRFENRTLFDVFDSETARSIEEQDRKMLAAGTPLTGTEEVVLNNEKRVMLTSRFPLAREDGEAIIGTIMLDITDMKRAEEERRRLELQMQHTQKLESLGVLGGGIAHDFNNLLVGILGHAELARTHLPEDSEVREHINKVIVTSTRAADLANQLLAYATDSTFEVEISDINEMVRELDNLLTISISKKAILKCELASELPAVECDPTRVRQIIMNLIVNASDALGESTGHITVRTGVRTCREGELLDMASQKTVKAGEYVFLQVRDTGCGMSSDAILKIFDPFFTTKLTGRGLGLAAVMGIVRSHEGAITVDTTPGAGSIFAIYLPATENRPPEKRIPKADDPKWKGSGQILIADDEAIVLEVGCSMLSTLGFTPIPVTNGLEALETFTSQRETISAIILDMSMPEMDGREAFDAIRKIDPTIPIIVSSGYSQDRADFSGLADASKPRYLQKPYQLDGLRRILRRSLQI